MVRFRTALGTCGVTWSDAGITRVLLPGARGLKRSPCEARHDAPDDVLAAIGAIVSLLEGTRTDLRWVVLDETGIDPFRHTVYAVAREVPAGVTVTYGDIAHAIGKPDAPRAVGAALADNPFPVIVPCHRVLSATGGLHGFSAPGGIATKRRMLEIERAPGFNQLSLLGFAL
ncbi:MAG: methylated-DNA--[protein]-cysteine S-methyltransferase [Solirubrobacteraceae bacterium]